MRYLVSVLLLIPFIAGSAAASANEAVPTMADILVELNHFPSDDDKDRLQAIVADENSTDHERAVAKALMNVEHTVSADDKKTLTALTNDESVADGVRLLAEALLGLNHNLAESEETKIRALMSH
ncbi:MAG: hypothetical protein U5K76_09200 [Woeseiaceae bacterium]|nr:hypothetical protein [Woeseiaceae bacterium]